MRLRLLLASALLFGKLNMARAEYVIPQMGGGQVSQGAAPMKHADVSFDGQNLQVHVDTSVGTPLLRPLEAPYEFDPGQPWSVLGSKAYNFQHGWNPAGFISVPPESWIWIEQLAATPGLEAYQRPPAAPPYEPIFTTSGSSPRWRWNGGMTHNVYAVQDPSLSRYQVVYRVYLGADQTGEPLPSYGDAVVAFEFAANPVIADEPGDFDGNGLYNCSDIDALTAAIAAMSGETAFDLNADGNVDAADRDVWLAQAGAVNVADTVGRPYLLGDATLDGVVDEEDFSLWNHSRFTDTPAWCAGDFNVDGVVDVSDFNIWNTTKFQHAGPLAGVPEPASWSSAWWAFVLLLRALNN